MRALLQRVKQASVCVDGELVGQISYGWLILLGIGRDDSAEKIPWMAEKCAGLRAFEDDAGKMNRSVVDVGGQILVVSQFTLYGDCSKGKRPSFDSAAPPELAESLYDSFCAEMRTLGLTVVTGRFRANMQVSLVNDGPVTLMIER
jgi:D-aminoacyl-tRNA deacylase